MRNRRKMLLLLAKKKSGGEAVTVSGVSPLSLVNALAHSIKRLTQYGKLSVSGSTITCNNGELKVVNNEIVADGTPEEIVVSATGAEDQTATAENLFAVDDIVDEQDIITGKVIRRTEAVVSDGTTPSGRYVGEVGVGNIIVKARETGYTGEVVSFTTEEETPLNGLRVKLEPIQDLHGYDNPWPSGGGKNKFNKDDPSCILDAYVVSTNGSLSAATSGEKSFTSGYLPAGTYTISKVSSSRFRVAFFETIPAPDSGVAPLIFDTANPQTATSLTITVPSGGYFVVFAYNGSSETVTVQQILDTLQIEAGSSATAWTPYSNICPISGHTDADVTRTGKNLADASAETVKILGSANGYIYNATGSHVVKIEGGKTYTISMKNAQTIFTSTCAKFPEVGDATVDAYTGTGGQAVNSKTITTSASAKYLVFHFGSFNYEELMVNEGATAEEYTPYVGTTYPIPLGTTVYGGTLDVLTGVLTVTMAMVDLGTWDWAKGNANNDGTGYIFRHGISGMPLNTNAISSHFKRVVTPSAWEALHLNEFCIPAAYVCVCADYPDASAFKTAVSGVQLCYELATPQTIQLTPQQVELLQGENNIWSNAKSVNVYVSDGELIVQVTPQKLKTAEGTNVVEVTSNVDPAELDISYKARRT